LCKKTFLTKYNKTDNIFHKQRQSRASELVVDKYKNGDKYEL